MALPHGYDLSAVKRIDTFQNPEVQVRTVALGLVASVVAWLLADAMFVWWYCAYESLFWVYAFTLHHAPRRVGLRRYLLIAALGLISMSCLLSICLYLYALPLNQLHYGAFILYFAVAMNTVALRVREPMFYLIDIGALYVTALGFAVIEFGRNGFSIETYLIAFGVLMFCLYHGYLVYEMNRERVKQEAARQRQIASEHERATGQISGGVAHDFNNLLTVVLGNLELARSMRNEADRNQVLAEAETAARRGATLTGQLLAFSRKAALSPAPIDVETLRDELSPLAERMLGRKHRLQVGQVSGLPSLYADSATLLAVLLNLILNAKEAMPAGGTIWLDAHISARGGKDMMCLQISDMGAGIPPHIRSQVFEPFFSTKPAGQGSGLGLPMALGFAEQSGGDIEVISHEGDGTQVGLYLPLAEIEENARVPAEPTLAAQAGE